MTEEFANPGQRTEPILIDAKSLGDLLHLSLRSVRTLDAGGKLPKPLRLGASVRWCVNEIHNWTAAGAPDRATWEAMKKPENRKRA